MKKFEKHRRRLIKWSHFRFNNYFRRDVRRGAKWNPRMLCLTYEDDMGITYAFYSQDIYERYCKKYGPIPLVEVE